MYCQAIVTIITHGSLLNIRMMVNDLFIRLISKQTLKKKYCMNPEYNSLGDGSKINKKE